jgi:hypothetical protein
MKRTLLFENVNSNNIKPLVNGVFMIRDIMVIKFHKINVWA